uniref:Putative salivary lipocalin n=1 Tax=Ixodes ricinus TaxID=34613 RepID=A0A0K8RJQ0_IXORI
MNLVNYWMREELVKRKCASQVITEVETKKVEENEEEASSADKATNWYDSSFKKLPSSCRYAFLLNCGYLTYRIYDKEDCDKINEKKMLLRVT